MGNSLFSVGCSVHLTPKAAQYGGEGSVSVAKVEHLFGERKDRVRLDRPLGGCHYWHETDLETAEEE